MAYVTYARTRFVNPCNKYISYLCYIFPNCQNDFKPSQFQKGSNNIDFSISCIHFFLSQNEKRARSKSVLSFARSKIPTIFRLIRLGFFVWRVSRSGDVNGICYWWLPIVVPYWTLLYFSRHVVGESFTWLY